MFQPSRHLGFLLLVIVSVVLAAEPVRWLWLTWTDVSWGSEGELVFLGVLGVFVWSLRSRRTGDGEKAAWTWLGVSALVRALGNLLAINVLSALMLCVDVFAIAKLARLDERERPVSPMWLAVAFAFSLPVERMVQRLVGHALQWISAQGAWGLLQVIEDGVVLQGMELAIRGTRVLVDLPCSGARGLTILTTVFMLLCAIRRPSWVHALWGMAIVVTSAIAANTVRIVLLAEGIVYRDALGLDVMSQPWHDIVGLLCLALALIPVIGWARIAPASEQVWRLTAPGPRAALVMLAVGLSSLAFVNPRPIDVSSPIDPPRLPQMVAGYVGVESPLSPVESRYFATFGGGAARAIYGSISVLVVKTQSPLRHIHTPEECMAGAGWDVTRLGITGRTHPGATWRVRRGEESMDIRASYVSSKGHVVTNVEEAIFNWLGDPSTVWTAVERTYPVAMTETAREAVDREIFLRLGVTINE